MPTLSCSLNNENTELQPNIEQVKVFGFLPLASCKAPSALQTVAHNT